ncbi:hypothetical protein OGW15_10160 [Citrobacter sp. Cf039]|uniref:hypothetical protein n=1 Tax=Citrobacter TaxID=544 RepID=UPI001CD23B5E|nr:MULTISPECIES: hypothetical protein [Citrobacter]MDM3264664.1 hypothetical protein [Citrobacter sp. Cf039]MDM3265269.1 hypothetical protein [Citrobacter sp. Cf039]MDM3345412.1 hypothetical protein [Citrobacter sp. Cf115]
MFKGMAVSMLAVVILSGCSNQEAIKKHTASGKPEAEYPGKTKEQVKDALVSYCNQKGLSVFESTESLVICGKQTDSVLAQMLVGNSYSTPSMAKIRFTIASVNNAPKVWSDMWIESQMPGGQLNQMPSKNNTDINSVQNMLDNLQP